MKKIKIYIVTYNNDAVLRKNLKSVFNSDVVNYDYEVNVINNHSKIGDFSDYDVNIINNTLRPDFSTGHLARNWNQALINGFKDLKNPDAEIVLAMQNDTVVVKDLMAKLLEQHKKYTFIQNGAGDNLMSWTVDGVKKVGLFDERFCNMACQEGDYFLRQVIYNGDKASISDKWHGRFHNKLNFMLCGRTHDATQAAHKAKSTQYHNTSNAVFRLKWAPFPHARWTPTEKKKLPKSPNVNSFMFYPYFEKDVETLQAQRYIV